MEGGERLLTSNELRTKFLEFFKDKGHTVIPSSSLVPHGDPTLLLTSAGMVQIKPYFLGEAIPPNRRLASCQKCFRTTDIESVGDSTHLTFFEMLGNFSVGDYFKKEAISWGWEFVTEWLNLQPERLWVTVFLDDSEAFGHWRRMGIPENKILRFGEEDNFWGPAGDSGPCGPCSEIFYDFGEGVGCGKSSCAPNCGCARFTEIWNLVFTQYNQDRDGKRTLLPNPNIDTGMGLERTTAAIDGRISVYETGLFASLIHNISGYIGKKYGSNDEIDKAMRVIVEHGRALTFLIADGVMPSKEGRGYVLRRLIRRAALYGRKLGLERPFLNQIAGATVGTMAEAYPELRQRQSYIYQVVESEESKFRETLSTGLELLDGIMNRSSSEVKDRISGEDAFKLYDTYGFPVELTKEFANERGFSVDTDGFEKEMEKQRERAKASHRFELADTTRLKAGLDVEVTIFVGYNNLVQKSTILGIIVDNESAGVVETGQEAGLIIGDTPFYGEMGGQVGDTGEIKSSRGKFNVTGTVRIPPDIIIHQGRVVEGSLTLGDEVEAEVDKERRLDIARNHTATHLLQMALRQVLGEHVQQKGSMVSPEQLRFDFSHLVAMTTEEIEQVNHIVNESIRQNLPVYDEEIPYKKAIDEGVIALFDEKYGDIVRVLKIGKPSISSELCGGTHVNTTGEIGFFHIVSESSIGAGLRRIEAVTGRGAEKFIDRVFSEWQQVAAIGGTSQGSIVSKVESLIENLDTERKRALTLERELSRRIAESLISEVEIVKGIKVISANIPSSRIEILREMSDLLRERLGNGIIVLGTVYDERPLFLAAVTEDLTTRGYNAGDLVKKVASIAGGGGGGKATLAQAGGKYKDKLDEALKEARKYVEEKHKS